MSRDLELELEMHAGFTPWVEKHSHDTDGRIRETGYDPERFHPQRIDTAFSPSNAEAGKNPAKALEVLRDQYAKTVGGFAIARAYISAFEDAKASDDGDELLIEVIDELLDDGKSIGLLTDHAEGLFDIAKGQGGLSIALANLAVSNKKIPEHIGVFRSWVNKLMTREFLLQINTTSSGKTITENVYIPDLLAVGGGIRWVVPDAENGARYLSNEKISQAVNHGALLSFAQDKRAGKGTIEAMVPSGTQMYPKRNGDGRIEYLVAPGVSEASANLLAHLDAIVTFSVWSGRISVGKLIEVNPAAKRKDPQRVAALAGKIRETMRQQTQSVSGVPVLFAEEIEQATESIAV